MAYDLDLAKRIKIILGGIKNLEEKKLFGGIGFLINGNMACGVNKNDMIVRIDPNRQDILLSRPHTRVFDLTGKPMKGWLVVAPEGLKRAGQLKEWISEGIDYARTLPAKKK